MGWFNVLKGSYPALDMITTTLPMQSGQTAIVRGSLLVNDAGSFRLTVAGDNAIAKVTVPYFALQAQTDWNSKMAGNLATQIPVIGGIPVTYNMEVETDQFDTSVAYAINDKLMIGAGVVTKYTSASTIVGIVTGVPRKRWVNDAAVAGGQRTGQSVQVISFLTLFIPIALINV